MDPPSEMENGSGLMMTLPFWWADSCLNGVYNDLDTHHETGGL